MQRGIPKPEISTSPRPDVRLNVRLQLLQVLQGVGGTSPGAADWLYLPSWHQITWPFKGIGGLSERRNRETSHQILRNGSKTKGRCQAIRCHKTKPSRSSGPQSLRSRSAGHQQGPPRGYPASRKDGPKRCLPARGKHVAPCVSNAPVPHLTIGLTVATLGHLFPKPFLQTVNKEKKTQTKGLLGCSHPTLPAAAASRGTPNSARCR